jgi:hypothetical protein
VGSSCTCGNESSGSTKCWEINGGYTTGVLMSSAQLHRIRNECCHPHHSQDASVSQMLHHNSINKSALNGQRCGELKTATYQSVTFTSHFVWRRVSYLPTAFYFRE